MKTEYTEIIEACEAAQHRMAGDQDAYEFCTDPEVMHTIQSVMEQAVKMFSSQLMESGMPPMDAIMAGGAIATAMILRVGFEAGKNFASIDDQRKAALAEFTALLDPTLAELTGETFTDPTPEEN